MTYLKLPYLQVLHKLPMTERRLYYFGMSFNNESFVTGSNSDPLSLPGIYVHTPGSPIFIKNRPTDAAL